MMQSRRPYLLWEILMHRNYSIKEVCSDRISRIYKNEISYYAGGPVDLPVRKSKLWQRNGREALEDLKGTPAIKHKWRRIYSEKVIYNPETKHLYSGRFLLIGTMA